MTSTPSTSSTLTSNHRHVELATIQTLDDLNHDTPVSWSGFRSNVGRCKSILLPGLICGLGLEVGHVIVEDEGGKLGKEERMIDIAGLIFMSCTAAIYLSSFLKPIPRSYTDDPKTHKALRQHRIGTTISFFLLILILLMHTLPGVIYTLSTHQTPPSIHPTSILTLGWVRNIVIVYSLLVVGFMRRGPRLRFEPMHLGTGFGVHAETKKGSHVQKTDDEEESALLGEEDKGSNVVDYQNSSLISFILLFYMAPLLRRSMSTSKLTLADIPHFEANIRKNGQYTSIHSDKRVKLDGQEGKRATRREVTGWMLVKSLFRGRYFTIFITLLIETAVTVFSFIGVIAMHEIIESFDRPGDDRSYAYLMCWGLLVGQCSDCFLSGYSWVRENYMIHMPVRLSLSSMLFSKILRTTDAQALEAHNVSDEENMQGKGRSMVMNLLTIDVSTVASLATHVWNLTNAVVKLLVGTIFMYRMFGIAAFIGIACVPLSAPASVWVAKQIYKTDKNWARARDARTGAIKEFLLGYKVIKLNAFEPNLRRRIEHLRDIEIVWQRYRFTLGTLFNILGDQLPALAIFVTFFVHTKVFNRNLDPSSAFVAWTVFTRVQSALQSVPSEINTLVVAKVAIERLVGYLNQEEIDLDEWEETSGEIKLEEAVISWPAGGVVGEEERVEGGFRLEVDVELPEGKMTLVCGPLGSGKTLFLRALLGEATVESGNLTAPRSMPNSIPLNGHEIHQKWSTSTWLNDTVAYAPQTPYIRHGTIQDNILFGLPLYASRYKESLRQASLLSDLDLMPDGDRTEVGEHGVNLSGGQKARINLARCIYSRAKTVYMDDILSAVDAHTAQFIFEECLTGKLLKGRTVVLVTHHVWLCLSGADFVVSLKEGRVDQACKASDAKIDKLNLPEPEDLPTSPLSPQTVLSPFSPGIKSPMIDPDDYLPASQTSPSRQIYTTEHSSTGRVAASHYMLVFLSAGSLPYWLIFALLYSSNELFAVLKTVYLKTWSLSPSSPSSTNTNLSIYALLVSSGMIFGGARWFWLYGIGDRGFYNRGSRVIHGMLLDGVCNAPMGWFERTPAGRIMNVFGQDVWRLDSSSADDFARTLSSGLHIVTSVAFVCFQAPALLVILVLFGSPLYWLSGVLIKLRADLRRLTATCGSPVISLYHDAIDGIVMIRAFGSCDLMMASMQALINRERQAYSADWMVYNWVKGMIRAIASIFVTATGFALVRSDMSGAQAGLILSFAMSTSTGLFNLLEQYSNLEQTFVSAERINHYIQTNEIEPTTGLIPPPSWPATGSIKFKDLSVRYAPDLPEVLHKINFTVEPGMRVGLVGSTGSGKSTLALALFRAVEACEGGIEIDGLDIGEVKLGELRRRLNMVAQDGSLSSGTLREALDITGRKDDREVYEALRRVHLLPEEITKEIVQDNPFANLDTFVATEGANFSQGQRQLLCLARALLKQSKILVMDEATSSVDFEMDAKITATIRECFAGTTMIVIAHRLATIMQYDRVLVLDKGRILEYASPLDLIEDEMSAFHGLCMAAGEEEYEKLLAMARMG